MPTTNTRIRTVAAIPQEHPASRLDEVSVRIEGLSSNHLTKILWTTSVLFGEVSPQTFVTLEN